MELHTGPRYTRLSPAARGKGGGAGERPAHKVCVYDKDNTRLQFCDRNFIQIRQAPKNYIDI